MATLETVDSNQDLFNKGSKLPEINLPEVEGSTDKSTSDKKVLVDSDTGNPIPKDVASVKDDGTLRITIGKPNPQANVTQDIKEKVKQDIEKQVSEEVTLDSIMSGQTTRVNGKFVNPNLVTKANAGDIPSKIKLERMVDLVKTKQQSGVKIAGVAEGKVSPEFKKDQSLNKYAEGRLLVLNSLKKVNPNTNEALVPDPKVQQLLLDYFSTGDFYTEMSRRAAEAGRGITMLPIIGNMAYNFVGAATDAFDLPGEYGDDVDFGDAWQKRQPAMSNFYTKYKSVIEDNLGMTGLTAASGINDDLKEKYIDKYGIDEYNRFYTVVNPVSKKRVEVPIISEEMGSELYKIGFDELPFSEKAMAYILENIGIGSVFAKASLDKGKRHSRIVKDLLDDDPVRYGNLSPIEILRKHRIDNATNDFTKGYYQFTQNIGRRLKNRGALGAAIVNEDRTNALNLLDKQIDSVKVRRSKLNPGDTRGSKLLDQELENLNTQRVKYIFPFPRKTYMSSTIADETVVGLGQAFGYEYLPTVLGVSSSTGEIFGALSTGIRAPQIIIKGAAGFLERGTGGASKTFFSILEKFPPIPRGALVDRRFQNLTDELNRPLSRKEKIATEEVAKLVKNLNPQQRELVYTSISEYQELRERIVNSFKTPEKRDKARKYFQLSFSEVSGLAPLKALENRALGKLQANGKNIEEAVEYQLQSEKTNRAATEAIDNLKTMLRDDLGVDADDREFISDWTNNFTKAANDFERNLNATKIEYLEQLQSFKEKVLQNPDSPLPEDLVTTLSEMEIKLTAGAVDDIEMQRNIYAKTTQEVMKKITERGNNIIALRGSSDFTTKLAQFVEDVYDVRKDSVQKQSRLLYQSLDSSTNFDLTPLVQSMMDRKGRLVESDLKLFFSAEGKFFRNKSGREARQAFQSMAKRTLEKDLNLNEAQFDEMMTYHSNPNLLNDPATANDYIANATPVDVLIYYGKKSQEAGGLKTLNPFKADVYELDTIKRHFESQGRRLDKGETKDQANEFFAFAKEVEEVIKTKPKVYEKLAAVRKRYQALNFDPTRPTSLGEKIVNARAGPAKAGILDSGELKFNYLDGFRPETFHDSIGKNMQKILNNEPNAEGLLKRDIEQLVSFWSAGDMPDGSKVFDVTTEAGRDKVATLSTLVTANLYEHWGAARTSLLEKIARQKDYGQSLASTDYNFQDAKKISDLQNVLTINVNTANGVEPVKLVDVAAIVAQEKELITLMKLDKRASEQYSALSRRLKDKSNLLRTTADSELKIESKGIKNLERIADITDSSQFYETYIHNKPPSVVAGLRDEYVNARLSGLDVGDAETAVTSRAVLEDEFNKGIVFHMTNGLLERAGKSRSKLTLLGFDEQPFELDEITKAGQFASDLSNSNTQAVMREVGFTKNHIKYLDDMARFFEYAQGTSLARYDVTGTTRGISPNELISRSFNLARGMVSPTYVAGEMGARIAMQRRQELVALAAKSEEAARIVTMMLRTPDAIVPDDIKTLGTLIEEFVASDLARTGTTAPQFIDSDELYKSNMYYNGKPLFKKVLEQETN